MNSDLIQTSSGLLLPPKAHETRLFPSSFQRVVPPQKAVCGHAATPVGMEEGTMNHRGLFLNLIEFAC